MRQSQLGLAVRPLAPQEKQQAETDGNLVVEHVSGPAAAAGVQPGDIILGVNGKRVKSVEELQSADQGRRQERGAAHPARECSDLRAAAIELSQAGTSSMMSPCTRAMTRRP